MNIKLKHTVAIGATLACAGFFAGSLIAQDHKGHDHGDHAGHAHAAQEMSPEEMMQAYVEMSMPVEQHAKLAAFEGKWNQTQKHWMEPGAPPMVTEAVFTQEMIMGGRYLIDHVESTMMGMPFEGRGITGYDRATKKYFSVWFDNFGTGLMTTFGDFNDRGELVMEGEWSDPMSPTGKNWVKTKATLIGKDRSKYEMWMEGEDRKPSMVMEITSTRAH